MKKWRHKVKCIVEEHFIYVLILICYFAVILLCTNKVQKVQNFRNAFITFWTSNGDRRAAPSWDTFDSEESQFYFISKYFTTKLWNYVYLLPMLKSSKFIYTAKILQRQSTKFFIFFILIFLGLFLIFWCSPTWSYILM